MDPEQIPIRDLHLPAEIGWWPLAPGWWILIAIAAAGCAWLAWRGWLDWRRGRARRVALREFGKLVVQYRNSGDAVRFAKQLSQLLRRAMLAYAPRAEVAGLTGETWLAWLDRGLDQRPFGTGAGRNIEILPYRNPAAGADDVDVEGLIAAARDRLRTPLPEGAG
ncbi:MAG: DUF4381 domain-containing protein [Gammaproteobacteria bacterium]|nr:DUF4381 domain-containing protein [Gammaproteobacteria bacterium]MDH4255122.1 DUF4381 domain-containing protein [Gammaproteobacteria bacterium]MDH5310809.1 DUF4381 domain-containing protein [Gammaproteobacteria bacterium]